MENCHTKLFCATKTTRTHIFGFLIFLLALKVTVFHVMVIDTLFLNIPTTIRTELSLIRDVGYLYICNYLYLNHVAFY